ncbi:MAG: hypothetical protein AB1589_14885 [Cyanobacteriota bacterium]
MHRQFAKWNVCCGLRRKIALWPNAIAFFTTLPSANHWLADAASASIAYEALNTLLQHNG